MEPCGVAGHQGLYPRDPGEPNPKAAEVVNK
jgi:hypothetical protein